MYVTSENNIDEKLYSLVFDLLNILEKIDLVQELGKKVNLNDFKIEENIIKFNLYNNKQLLEITNNITSKYLVITIYKDKESYVYTVDINSKEIVNYSRYFNYSDKIIERSKRNNVYYYEVYYYNDDLNYAIEIKDDNFNEEEFIKLLGNNEINKIEEIINNLKEGFITKLSYKEEYKRKIKVNINRKGVN